MASADLLTADIPWYRTVSKEQWRAFFATFFGWVIDAFDYNMLAFVLIDIQQSFTVDRTLAGALATVTLVMRLAGGVIAGLAADKWGRKLPMTISILWFSLFAFLSGFSTSYAMLFAFRALFGIGMGGEWTSGMPLSPGTLAGTATRYRVRVAARRLVLGLSVGRDSVSLPVPTVPGRSGCRLARDVLARYFTGVPHAVDANRRSGKSRCGWRASAVSRRLKHAGNPIVEPRISLVRIFQRDLFWTTIHTTAADRRVHVFVLFHQSVVPDFPSRGRTSDPAFHDRLQHRGDSRHGDMGPPFRDKLGRRGAVTITALVGAASVPLYLHAEHSGSVDFGALVMGVFGCGIWGHGASLCDGTLSHGHSGRRTGLLLSRGCGDRRRDADPDRQAAGPRDGGRGRDDRSDRRLADLLRDPDLVRT